MADNYLGKKMEDFLAGKSAAPKRTMTFAKLVAKNRSYRGYDNSFTVRADQLRGKRRQELAVHAADAQPGTARQFRRAGGRRPARLFPDVEAQV